MSMYIDLHSKYLWMRFSDRLHVTIHVKQWYQSWVGRKSWVIAETSFVNLMKPWEKEFSWNMFCNKIIRLTWLIVSALIFPNVRSHEGQDLDTITINWFSDSLEQICGRVFITYPISDETIYILYNTLNVTIPLNWLICHNRPHHPPSPPLPPSSVHSFRLTDTYISLAMYSQMDRN